MKEDVIKQVQKLLSEQMKEAISNSKGQLTGIITEIVIALVSPIL